MLRRLLVLLGSRVGVQCAEMLHGQIDDVDYSNDLKRCSNDWTKPEDWYKDDDKNTDKHFYKTTTEWSKDSCLCAIDQNNEAYWEFKLKKSMLNVQTIIVVTLDMDPNFQFSIQTSTNSNSFTEVCARGTCKIGATDFSAAPLSSFRYLRLVWNKNVRANFCNVFLYDAKNYAPLATVTDNFSYADPQSYDFTQWSSGYMQGAGKWGYGWKIGGAEYDQETNSENTCVLQHNGSGKASTRISPMMWEFAQHMVIHDIFFLSHDTELQAHIVSANFDDANIASIKQIDETVSSVAKNKEDINQYGGSSDVQIYELMSEKVSTQNYECSNNRCEQWNTKRVIITNKNENDRNFFLCGLAIMAEPVHCKPSSNNCQNIMLQDWGTSAAAFGPFSMNRLGTVTTDIFHFKDSLTQQCLAEGAEGCDKTLELWCNKCANYQNYDLCEGNAIGSNEKATFTHSIDRTSDTSVEEYTLSVTSSGDPQNRIDHKCFIKCKMQSTEKKSVSFVLRESCSPCADTVIAPQTDGSSVPVVGQIPISNVVQYFNWNWFSDSVRDCGTKTCAGIEYSIQCRKDGVTTFSDDYDFTALLSTSSSIGKYTLALQSKKFANHNVKWWCKIIGQSQDSNQIAETSEFDITFNACIDPAQSCFFDTWSLKAPAGWVKPVDINIFLDGVPQGSSFNYANWYDRMYYLCGYQICGTIRYEFIDSNDDEITQSTLAIQPALAVTQGTDQITITAQTTNFDTVGDYRVRVRGTMILHSGESAWKGPALSITWAYFTISVVDPCTLSNACEYTTLIVDPYTANNMATLLAYFDNQAVQQIYMPFQDTVTNLCPFECAGYELKLVYDASDEMLPADLATLSQLGSDQIVRVKTTNFAYAGTHTVKIKCRIVQGGATITTAYSNVFDIVVEPCDTRSCIYSRLVQLSNSDTQPSSYLIGVDNVIVYTDFTPFSNTCGLACTSNPDICGQPTYTSVYAAGLSSGPSFSTVTESSTYIRHSSRTFDLNDEGDHVLKVKVRFDMSVYASAESSYVPSPEVLYTDTFTVTVDVCQPLPCDFNEIIEPSFGETMPEGMYVRTTGEKVSNFFTPYKDTVSMRCSNPYTDLCGPKIYTLEQLDGSSLPETANIVISYDLTSDLYRIDIDSTDVNIVALYNTKLRASFVNSYTNAFDDTSYEFDVIIDAAYPCSVIQCELNALVPIEENTTEYLLPSNFVVHTDYTWYKTNYDSWNDTKTEYCRGEPGVKDGVTYQKLLAPICEWPVYELINAHTGESMSAVFGANNIDIRFDYFSLYTSRWAVKVRAYNSALDGLYDVKLSVRLTEDSNPYYSNTFTIEISDPCIPYDCADTVFSPVDKTVPTDIEYSFGNGYQSSSGPLWDNYINTICGSKTQVICGPTRYVLMDAVTHEPVEFSTIISPTSSQLMTFVEITDESLIGSTLYVYLRGYGFDSSRGGHYGTNGTSQVFKIIINEPEEVVFAGSELKTNGPYFSSFPSNIWYDINPNGNDPAYIWYQLIAVAEDNDGEITSVSVNLGEAKSFMSYETNGGTIQITFGLTYDVVPGLYPVSIMAIDDSGLSVTERFQVLIIDSELLKLEGKNITQTVNDTKEAESKEPIFAVVKSISLTGLLTIEYNRHVIPLESVKPVTKTQFNIAFEQLSDEVDQTKEFQFELVGMTPKNVFVQLNFARPLEVSQGVLLDLVHVKMVRALFMVDDEENTYEDWQDGDALRQTLDTNRLIQKLQSKHYSDLNNFYFLSGQVPKQVESLEALQILEKQTTIISRILSGIFFGPLAFHLIGFGSMDYSWVVYNNLQMQNILGQFNLKLPQNVETSLKSMASEIHYQFTDLKAIYLWLRLQASDNPDYVQPSKPEPYMYFGPNYVKDCIIEECNAEEVQAWAESQDSRRLEERAGEIEALRFDQSRFYGMGAYELVLVTSSQLIVCLLIVAVLYFMFFVFEKSALHWMPKRFKIAFHYLHARIFWCFPLRLIMQQYTVITMSALLNMRFRNQKDTIENTVNRASSIMTLLFMTVGFPLLIWLLVHKLPLSYRTTTLFKRIDSLYLSVDMIKGKGVGIVGLSFVRKALVLWLAINQDINVVQVMFALLLQETYVVYLMAMKPMLGTIRNNVEFFNEILILAALIMLCTLTDYVPDPKIRYNVTGFIIIGMIYVQLAVNTFFLMLSIVYEIKRMFKIIRYYYVMRLRHEKRIVHNWTVEELGQHRDTSSLKPYMLSLEVKKVGKHKLANLNGINLEEISSLGSMEDQSSSLSIKSRPKKTIAQKRSEFQAMMDHYRQLETELPPMTIPQIKQLKEQQLADSEFLDQFMVDRGGLDDWKALPDDYQNPEGSVSLSSDIKGSSSQAFANSNEAAELWLVSERKMPFAELKQEASKLGISYIVNDQLLHQTKSMDTERLQSEIELSLSDQQSSKSLSSRRSKQPQAKNDSISLTEERPSTVKISPRETFRISENSEVPSVRRSAVSSEEIVLSSRSVPSYKEQQKQHTSRIEEIQSKEASSIWFSSVHVTPRHQPEDESAQNQQHSIEISSLEEDDDDREESKRPSSGSIEFSLDDSAQ